jgi:hypothetical protein
MESRRRLGRRRMAHLSEAFPTPSHGLTALWGSTGNIEKTQWQWEAPTKPPPKKSDKPAAFPQWLSQWDTSPKEASSELVNAEELRRIAGQEINPAEDLLLSFRQTLHNPLHGDVSKTCDEFTQRFKQCLSLGLVSDETLNLALQWVTVDIRKVAPNLGFAESQCLTFYQAIWEGIVACKVLRPIDFSAHIMNRLLSLLAQLPLIAEVKILAQSLLHSTSTTQLHSMIPGINMLINAWSQTWLTDPDIRDCTPCLIRAEQSIGVAATRVMKAHKLVMALEEDRNSEADFEMAQKAVYRAKMAIFEGVEAITEVDNVLLPFRTSIEGLADALSNVPRELLRSIISSCSDQITAICDSMEGSLGAFRCHWLSVIAQIPNADLQVLLENWRKVEASRPPLMEMESSDLVLSYWISQGYVKEAPLIRIRFEAYGSQHQDFGPLLFAPDKQKGGCRTDPGAFLAIWHKLGRYEMVYDILSRMLDLGIKVPVDILTQTLEVVSNESPRLALTLYNRYSFIRLGNHQLQLDRCPNFVVSMIKMGVIPPKVIWATLKIPLYEEIPPRPVSSKILAPSMINLIHMMAIEFARSEARSRRVSLRNVMQCLHHLRIHRVSVRPELARAIAYAGITKEVIREQWVGHERLRWALGLIAWVEGQKVADAIDRTVYHWRRHLTEKQRRRIREENVLHVGPID